MGSDKTANPNEKSKVLDQAAIDSENAFEDLVDGLITNEDTLFGINEFLHSGNHQSTRKNVRAPLAIKVIFRIGNEEFLGESYTLSSQGIFIKHPSPPPVSTPIEISLNFPDHKHNITASGKVVQSTSIGEASKKGVLAGMSIVFDSIDSKSSSMIDEMVRNKIKRIKKPTV